MRSVNWAEMLLPASASLASVSSAYPWVLLFGGDRPMPLGLCFTTSVFALLVARLSYRLPWQRARRLLLVASGILTAVLTVWWLHGSSGAAAWWSTYWLGWIGHGGVGHSLFQTETVILTVLYWSTLGLADWGWGEVEARQLLTRGLVAIMLYTTAARLVGISAAGEAGQMATPYIALFLGSVFMTLALARARTVRQRGQQKGVEQTTLTYSWLPLAALLILFAVLAGSPLLPLGLGLVLSGFRLLVSLVLTAIAIPIGYLAEWVITAVRQMMKGQPLEQQPQVFRMGDELRQLQEQLQNQPQETPLWVSIAFAVVVAVVVMVIVARRISLTNQRDDGTFEEERESLHPKLNLLATLRRFASRRPRSLAGRKRWLVGSIEELYLWLLRMGVQVGRPRQSHETPLEYQRVMADRCPERALAIAQVTDAFERSRYGNETISQDELSRLAAARELQEPGC